MESTDVYTGPEPHIEVHKYYAGVVPAAVVLALVLQAFFPVYIRSANYLELPLLVTLYFALSKRNPSSGLMLGMVVGLLQDSLSRTPLGLYGISKTLVGYLGSSLGSRIDVEHPIARFLLTAVFYIFHHAVFTLMTRTLLGQRNDVYFTVPVLIASLVNAVVAIGLFPLLDRFRKPS
jgi:rod shape-determining protein MreD